MRGQCNAPAGSVTRQRAVSAGSCNLATSRATESNTKSTAGILLHELLKIIFLFPKEYFPNFSSNIIHHGMR